MRVFFVCSALAAFLVLSSSQKFDLCDKTDDEMSEVFVCIRGQATESLKKGLKSLWPLTKCNTDICMAYTFCRPNNFPTELAPFLTHEEYVELEKLLGECLDKLPKSHVATDTSGILAWIMSYFH